MVPMILEPRIAAYLLGKGRNAETVLRTFGTVLIIISAIFLVVVGYNDTQISPVMGLLGTIAGYLLGKETREAKPIESANGPGKKPE
ncbi:MAG: hypothetical protein ACHQYP_06610 [Nitrospiria bacterium]